MLRRYLKDLWDTAERANKENIFRLLEADHNVVLLDCGCDTGDFTLELANRLGTKTIYGIDVVPERCNLAKERGITVLHSDLNYPLPVDSDSIDALHANQVIEHLTNFNSFIEEIKRVLKLGGYAIISTENLSSWHNIFALALGFQLFSLTNIALGRVIENPLALHSFDTPNAGLSRYKTFRHVQVFAYRGLTDLFFRHGLQVETVLAAGYHPFPSHLSKLLARVDAIHAAFLTLKARKTE